MNDAIKTQISAFVDGELPDNESEMLLRRLSHDIELRQQAAEYFAIGRALRGHRGVQGIGALRERIATAIDDNSIQAEFDAIEPVTRRYLRPVAGVAIAATVALTAIVGLQLLNGVAEFDAAPVDTVATGDSAPQSYTEPELHRDLHNMEAGNLDALLVTFRRRESDIDESEAEDEEEVIDELQAEEPEERQAP